MLLLTIESSCDEFSIAIMKDGKILSNIVSSQVKEHSVYGGVIPELAARLHVENFPFVLQSAINESKIKIKDIDYIGYTQRPGLIGSLIVGKMVAETIGMYLKKPVIPLDHIEGHIYGAKINKEFVYPVLVLVVSGGHTQIELIDKPLNFKIIGETQDDAIGECYDKVARILGLEYPGGPKIDILSAEGDPTVYKFPKIKTKGEYDFSYSGLKTASINLVHKLKQNNIEVNVKDFCASFQEAAVNIVLEKSEQAIIEFKPSTIVLAGGVSANSKLRKNLKELGQKYNIKNILIPELEYCTDNAAMMASLLEDRIKNKKI